MSDSMETIPPRLNYLEKEVHTHAHRITQLESLPGRVSTLERDFAAMNVLLADIRKDTSETRKDVGDVKTYQDKMAGATEMLPRYIKVTCFIVFVAGLAAVAGVWAQ